MLHHDSWRTIPSPPSVPHANACRDGQTLARCWRSHQGPAGRCLPANLRPPFHFPSCHIHLPRNPRRSPRNTTHRAVRAYERGLPLPPSRPPTC